MSVSALTYARVQQFYVHQLGLLDQGRPDDWADLFTVDAEFVEVTRARLRGREVIRAAMRARADQVVAKGMDFFRHWLGMLHVEQCADGSLRTRSYAMAMYTPTGGKLNVYANVVCRDVLVRQSGTWLVRSRDLRLDGG
nr:nuclear transport factor 2 family protein [Kibdelosporangium sp. MJ126-NF4]CEL20574.1 hypothetical protein [Kibdelosporangium sp. MJ126-NF4]CTQ89485.1 hypothetical protein [Kibdelosporangium sp. MJ126-NF4]